MKVNSSNSKSKLRAFANLMCEHEKTWWCLNIFAGRTPPSFYYFHDQLGVYFYLHTSQHKSSMSLVVS